MEPERLTMACKGLHDLVPTSPMNELDILQLKVIF